MILSHPLLPPFRAVLIFFAPRQWSLTLHIVILLLHELLVLLLLLGRSDPTSERLAVDLAYPTVHTRAARAVDT